MGAKGGVGTTTVALNAAAILAGPNKTVIALELRPLGSSFCLQLQQTPNRNLSHLMDLEVDLLTEEAIKTCLVSLPSGMSTLCAAQKTDQFREIRPEQVEALIRCAAQIADYVIIDLPSEVCGFSQSAVRACDLMTVVVERDPTCLAAGRVAVQSLEEWGVEAHALSAVIVIKDALRAFVSVEELGIRLGCSIAGSIAPAYDLCLASARAGTPLAVLDPDSIAAANLTTMAEKLASPILAAALVLV